MTEWESKYWPPDKCISEKMAFNLILRLMKLTVVLLGNAVKNKCKNEFFLHTNERKVKLTDKHDCLPEISF